MATEKGKELTFVFHFATSLEKGTSLKSEVTVARAEFSHRLPYSVYGIIHRSPTGVERSPSAGGAQEIYLEPPQSSDVIRPFKADRFQAFFQTALDAGEPTCS